MIFGNSITSRLTPRNKHLLMLLWLFAGLSKADSGVYLSQFASGDPLALQGGTDPVYLLVVDRGATVVYTVNSEYEIPGSKQRYKVWSYGIIGMSQDKTANFKLNDSFGVCDVSMTTAMTASKITVNTVASFNIVGAANPAGLNCLDLYPLISRTFTKIF